MGDISGNCQTGQMAAGLNINEKSFVSLLPRFPVDKQPSLNVLRTIISGFDHIRQCFIHQIHFLKHISHKQLLLIAI